MKNTLKMDLWLLGATIIATIIGIISIYSAGSSQIAYDIKELYEKQIVWAIIGIVIMFIVAYTNYQIFGEFSFYIYLFSIFLLLITLIFGREVRGTKAWLYIGGISIQPSEFSKLAVVILLGKYLDLRGRNIKHLKDLIIPTFIVLLPIVLINLQPDFGTSLAFLPIFITMLYIGGADTIQIISALIIGILGLGIPTIFIFTYPNPSPNTKHIFSLILLSGGIIFLLLSGIVYIFRYFTSMKRFRITYRILIIISLSLLSAWIVHNYMKEYQKMRLFVFIDPELDKYKAGYNIIQSKIAVGSGGLFGKGITSGTQNQLGFLPERHADFIFSVIGEELGFVGSFFTILILFIIVYRGIRIALESKNLYGSLLASGIVAMFFYHFLINIGMAIGIMPVTGIPLLFISYGGSSLIMSYIAIGILQSIYIRRYIN